MSEKIRVLIVDDSALMREALRSILNSDPSIEVVGAAKNGKEGVEKAGALKPDVITMDLRMPLMTGLEAIQEIMRENPIPIIVVSTMDVKVIIKALGIGAMDFVAVTQEIEEIAKALVEKVKIASRVKPLRRMKLRPPKASQVPWKRAKFRIVTIGVSTGGPQALEALFSGFPKDFPAGILIVQHIAEGFVEGLAQWLKSSSAMDVRVARSGDTIKKSTVLFAPDGYNVGINVSGVVSLSEDTEKASVHVPSIDSMMKSVARAYGAGAIGVIMTGMGHDGVEGMKAIKDAGGMTIAQDEKSSIVFGMNKAAIETGCIDRVVSLERIADELIKGVAS